jgi:hypothetical protein
VKELTKLTVMSAAYAAEFLYNSRVQIVTGILDSVAGFHSFMQMIQANFKVIP